VAKNQVDHAGSARQAQEAAYDRCLPNTGPTDSSPLSPRSLTTAHPGSSLELRPVSHQLRTVSCTLDESVSGSCRDCQAGRGSAPRTEPVGRSLAGDSGGDCARGSACVRGGACTRGAVAGGGGRARVHDDRPSTGTRGASFSSPWYPCATP
jgi:hypothetical protein